MPVEITDVADTAPRRAIVSFDPYEDAQALVDRLADGGFPGERLATWAGTWRSSSASRAGSTPGAPPSPAACQAPWRAQRLGCSSVCGSRTTACRWAPSSSGSRWGRSSGQASSCSSRPERRTGSPGRQVSCQRPSPPPRRLSVAARNVNPRRDTLAGSPPCCGSVHHPVDDPRR